MSICRTYRQICKKYSYFVHGHVGRVIVLDDSRQADVKVPDALSACSGSNLEAPLLALESNFQLVKR